MVLGIIAVVFSFIPVIGIFVALPCVGVGLPLSGIAFYRARKEGAGLGTAIAGLATNIVAIFISVGWIVLIAIGVAAD